MFFCYHTTKKQGHFWDPYKRGCVRLNKCLHMLWIQELPNMAPKEPSVVKLDCEGAERFLSSVEDFGAIRRLVVEWDWTHNRQRNCWEKVKEHLEKHGFKIKILGVSVSQDGNFQWFSIRFNYVVKIGLKIPLSGCGSKPKAHFFLDGYPHIPSLCDMLKLPVQGSWGQCFFLRILGRMPDFNDEGEAILTDARSKKPGVANFGWVFYFCLTMFRA